MEVPPAPDEAYRPRVLVVGGPDVHLRLDLMDRLASRYDVVAAGSEPKLERRFRERGYEYHFYPLRRGAHPFADLCSARRLEILMRRERPDVVHAFATKPSVWARIAADRAGVPVIVGTIPGLGELYARNDVPTQVLRAVYERLQRWACSRADATVFQNEDDRRELVEGGVVKPDATVVIPGSGVDTEYFDPARIDAGARRRIRASIGVPEDTRVVMLVSRLARSKGILDFAEAARLCAADASLRFVLVGPQDRTARNGLDPEDLATVRERVTWLGERTDVRELLAAADLFAFPSYYREGVPRVLLEAAAMELPIVAARATGTTEIVLDGITGILCEPRDPVSMAAAVRRMATDAELRRSLGREARTRVVERFGIEKVAEATAALYDALLESARINRSRLEPRANARGTLEAVRRPNHGIQGRP